MVLTDQRSMLLKVSEVADELRVARSYAYRLIQEGELPVVRIGRSVRVPRTALEAWVRDRTRETIEAA